MLPEFSFVFPTLDRHFTWRLGSSCLHSAVRLLFNGWITDDSMDHDRRTIPKRNSWRRTFNFILNGKYSDVLCNSSLSVISFFFIACQFQYFNFCEISLPAGIYRNFWAELMRYSTSLLAHRFLRFSLHCFSYLKRTERSWAKLRIISEVKVPKNQPDRKNQQVVSQNRHFRPLMSRRKWWTEPKMSKLHSQFHKMSNIHKFSA